MSSLGFLPGLIHYGLITLVSVTAVGAFGAVGSILVVAMMIGPAAAAYLLTDHLPRMLGLSALIGMLFLVAFLFAPERGMIALARRRNRQKWEFAKRMPVIHLLNHENSPEAEEESRVEHMHRHMR